jgi:porphobilinogen synthase
MPVAKLRKLRENQAIRDLVSETRLRPEDFILPYFVVEGNGVREPIKSMPGIRRLSIDNLLKDIREAEDCGIRRVLLFGIPEAKDKRGTEAYNDTGIVQKAVKAVRKEFGNLIVITDVCLCGYTSHGHCGVVKKKPETRVQKPEFEIDNDETLKILAKIAVSHAGSGADFVAPSAMMDGQVRAIREALDKNGFKDTKILAYSAKYASNFYGPFREAVGSSPGFGDRKSYQMDYRNSDEALREIKEDIVEGADIVMVKPALSYLDIIHKAKENFNTPVAAYSVSGEYAMVSSFAGGEKELVLEILTSIKRAGADFIITYWAKDAAKWLKR